MNWLMNNFDEWQIWAVVIILTIASFILGNIYG